MSTYRVSKTVYSNKRRIPYPYVAKISIDSEKISVKEIECTNNVNPQLIDWILLFGKLISNNGISTEGICHLMIDDREVRHPQPLILSDFYGSNGIGLWCKKSAADVDGRQISQLLEEIYVIKNYHSIPSRDLWIIMESKETGDTRRDIYKYWKDNNPSSLYEYYGKVMDSFIVNRKDWEITQLSD